MKRRCPLLLLLLAHAGLPLPLHAQSAAPDSSWNGPRAIELARRAAERRTSATADSGLVNYRADARVFVYFYLDREDTGQRNLVKTDQLALELLWAAPNHTQQKIVGWRNEKSLPTNIHYHLDHLTVVMENFGNVIQIGDGDEVRGVLHPAAPGATRFYDYRLADSLTLRLPGTPEPVRVYELQVRPKDPSRPGFVGSLFVDRRAGDIVRMDFTFTSAAYVDPSLDYINLSLDNGLWRGRYWLPNEQRVELRRRITQLDIPAGAVIRATMRVSDYRFNQPLPPNAFAGPKVITVPEAQRDTFHFEEGLHAEVREEGIGPSVELGQVREMARELVRQEALKRVSALRLSVPALSDVLRYDRAEGLVLAPELAITPREGLRLRGQAGWAFGAEHALGALSLETQRGADGWTARLYLNQPRDLSVEPVVSGAMNSLSTLVAGSDFTDLSYTSGAVLRWDHALSPRWSLAANARAERQQAAELGSDYSLLGDLRSVREIDEGYRLGAGLALRRTAPAGMAGWWSGELSGRIRAFEEAEAPLCARGVATIPPGECHDPGTRAVARTQPPLTRGWRWAPAEAALEVSGRAGAVLGEAPLQALFPLGGRGTLPGYDFRAYGGDRFATLSAVASANLWRPWVRGRLSGALGWAGASDDAAAVLRNHWGVGPTGQVKPSVGVGVGLVSGILHVDLARGLGAGGRWEVIVDANPAFWDFL